VPRATVLTTVFNGARFVDRYCGNVRGAAGQDLLWLLVDDGSDDGAPKAVAERLAAEGLADGFRLLTPGRLGRPRALNHGVAAVETGVCFLQDFDDESFPERFPLQLERLASDPALACVGGGYRHVLADEGREEIRCLDFDPARYLRQFPLFVPFPHTFMAFRTESVRKVGGYPEWDDYEEMGLIGRLLAAGYGIDAVNAVVGRHFIYPGSYFEARQPYAVRRWRAMKRQLAMRREFPFVRPGSVTIAARFAYAFLPAPFRHAVRKAAGHAR